MFFSTYCLFGHCQTSSSNTSAENGLTFEFQIISQETIQIQNLALIIEPSSIQIVDSNARNASDDQWTNQTNSNIQSTANISMLLQYYLDLLPSIQLPPPEILNASISSDDISLLFTTSNVVDTNLCPLDYVCQANSTAPQSCPLNTITQSTGTSDTCEVAPLTYICETGYFFDRLLQNCTRDCGAGFYGNVFTLGFCMGCPMGTFSNLNFATQCMDCQNGKYSDTIAATSCLHCAFGKSTSPYSGYTNCVKVFLYFFWDPNYYLYISIFWYYLFMKNICLFPYIFLICVTKFQFAQACQADPGYYCPDNTLPASICPAGYYCSGQQLPNGYHYDTCPINTYNPTQGANSLDQCLDCSYYEVAQVLGSTQCSVCPAGTYYQSSNPGGPAYGGSCVPCQAGASSTPNSTTCDVCPTGSYATSGSTCKLCKPGFYADQIGLSQCSACPSSTYTFTSFIGTNGATNYNVSWGSTSYSQCKTLPTNFGQNLVCIAGQYITKQGLCADCPKGYYCPTITTQQNKEEGLRVCPQGTYSLVTGAITSAECSQQSKTPPFTFDQCSISKNDASFQGLKVTSVTSSFSRKLIYFTTNNAVYRMYLEQSAFPNTIDLIAGNETESGPARYTIFGPMARFSALTAIAVEYDNPEASIAVVGDGQSVRSIDIFSRKVQLLGSGNLVSMVGGIAIKKHTNGQRLAYVSDTNAHRIVLFNLDTYAYSHIAGSFAYAFGFSNGIGIHSLFKFPKGLAFAQRDSSSVTLLVADSGNNMIRQIDVSSPSSTVSNWFTPIDLNNPEISNPVSISVVDPGAMGNIYYISQGNKNVKVIQYPDQSDTTFKTVSTLNIVSNTENIHSIFPFDTSVTVSSSIGYKQFLVFQQDNFTVKTLVETSISNSEDGGSTNANGCHLKCNRLQCANLTHTTTCGNSFLDPGEDCDNAAKIGGGCEASCRFKPHYSCPQPETACADPCPAFAYNCITDCPGNQYHNKSYCKEDCQALPWRPGFKIDEFCVESDIDECAEELGYTNNCPTEATCRNTDGSYVCSCLNSYFGDGKMCKNIAYAVYTVIDIHTYTKDQLDLESNPLLRTTKNVIHNKLKQAFSTTLFDNLPIQNQTSIVFRNSNQSLQDLIRMHTFISLDPNTNGTARLEISSLFESSALAELAASQTTKSQLDIALSQAIFLANDGVSTVQNLKTRTHDALGFTSVNVIDGWGMNISSVTYNRSCTVSGVSSLRGGCWEIEMIYMGGPSMPKSNVEAVPTIQQSKNLLYFPRIDKDPETFEMLKPMQALTMSNDNFFGCGTTDGSDGIPYSATACCLRDVNATFRTNTKFSQFLDTGLYNDNVPRGVCDSREFNTSWPNAEILSLDPENTHDGSTNDLVVGKIDGMPYSEVRLLETLDYTTRTFKVLIVLEEGDLRQSASLLQGIAGINYNLTFFVGLANFKPMGGSILSTRTVRQKITVSKSNILTLSTYGANQDPLVSSIDLKLKRIKVTNFWDPVRYLYYLEPTITLPPQFTAPEDGTIVPLNGIRVLKTTESVTGTDPNWRQACLNRDNTHIYSNQSLRDLVSLAQAQDCVMSDLRMCTPPTTTARNIIQFGIPLPEDYISFSDFRDVDPYKLNIQVLIVAKQTNPVELVRTTMSMAIYLTPLSYMTQCDSLQAAQNLSDIIEGNIYIGVAKNNLEWNNNVKKKVNIDQPGTKFSDSFQFDTTTVEGSVMTFAALGSKAYFEDPRNLQQYVKINDLHTVHFLEPIGGKGGASPNFDNVVSRLQAGTAFRAVEDPGNKSVWLEPTQELLSLCPKTLIAGKLTCRTRTDSTNKNNVLVRTSKEVIEVKPNSSSIGEMKTMIAYILQQGASTDYTDELGEDFHQQLVSQLNLDARYRKAYVINPVFDWSSEAITASRQVATSFTVCTKIVAVGLVTIYSATGAPLGRRMLSLDYSAKFELPPFPGESTPNSNLLRRNLLQTNPQQQSASSTAVQLSKTQLPNSLQLNLNIPEFDEISQLCSIYNNVPFSRCAVFELVVQIPRSRSQSLCDAYRQGSLSTIMEDSIYNQFVVKNPQYSISDLTLLNFQLENCDAAVPSSNSRNLLQLANKFPSSYDYVLSYHHVALSVVPGQPIYFNAQALRELSQYLNSDVLHKLLGGGASVVYVGADFKPGNNNTIINVDIYLKNGTKPNQTLINIQKPSIPNWNQGADDMFIADYSSIPTSDSSKLLLPLSSNHYSVLCVFIFNLLLSLTIPLILWE